MRPVRSPFPAAHALGSHLLSRRSNDQQAGQPTDTRTAGAFGFLVLIQSGERPERYRDSRCPQDRVEVSRNGSSRVSIPAFFALKKCVLHFIVDHNQPFLRGSGTLPKVICLDLKLTRSLLSSAQLRRKFVCEVHGTCAIFLGTFSRFV